MKKSKVCNANEDCDAEYFIAKKLDVNTLPKHDIKINAKEIVVWMEEYASQKMDYTNQQRKETGTTLHNCRAYSRDDKHWEQKESKGMESTDDVNEMYDMEYNRMTPAQKILTNYSDGHYTQFDGWENILMAMEEYAHQQPKQEEHSKVVYDVLESMVGIGGIPSNESFYAEFDMRLRAALKVEQEEEKPVMTADAILDTKICTLEYGHYTRTTVIEAMEEYHKQFTR